MKKLLLFIIIITIIMRASTLSSAKLSTTEAKTAKFWNRLADNYSKEPIKDQETYQKKLEITREYMTPSSNVLEFGCGTGSTAILHAPYVNNVRAIDLSSRMIEIAQGKAKEADVKNVNFECTGIDSLDVPKESFDVVLGMSVLHLLPNKNEVMKKVYNQLKPNGYFVSSTSCIGDFAKYIGWIASPFSHFGLIPKLNVFTKVELRSSMEEAGFQIEREFHPANDNTVFLVARKV
jgi:2-polyprenyl-3-methyl-5-hydroxy-6-metoxy-1,4-benzoquinol methylase